MKQYQSLGELLLAYRKYYKKTQLELAVALGVEVRTLSRWENDDTLVKPEKEKDLVMQTFIPYQVIRNLNAAIPIPVYYDFEIRKYSLSTITNRIPTAEEFKTHIEAVSPRLRPIESSGDIHSILEFYHGLDPESRPIRDAVIEEAVRILPELNSIIEDNAGYYAGHSVYFPISPKTHEKIKNREIRESQLTASDLIHYQVNSDVVLHSYTMYADCSENNYFMMANALRFLKNHDLDDNLVTGVVKRKDGLKTLHGMGFEVLWEEEIPEIESDVIGRRSYMEGRIKDYLQDLK